MSASWSGERVITVASGTYSPGNVAVEGDATAATYFAALATLHGGKVELTNLGASSKQGDYYFFDLMELYLKFLKL